MRVMDRRLNLSTSEEFERDRYCIGSGELQELEQRSG